MSSSALETKTLVSRTTKLLFCSNKRLNTMKLCLMFTCLFFVTCFCMSFIPPAWHLSFTITLYYLKPKSRMRGGPRGPLGAFNYSISCPLDHRGYYHPILYTALKACHSTLRKFKHRPTRKSINWSSCNKNVIKENIIHVLILLKVDQSWTVNLHIVP